MAIESQPLISSKPCDPTGFLNTTGFTSHNREVKGYGFISCEAFPDQDVFVLKSELPQGAKEGGKLETVGGLLFQQRLVYLYGLSKISWVYLWFTYGFFGGNVWPTYPKSIFDVAH